ncbi:type VI secretion protein, partial [Roseomonas mucosa]
MADDHEFRVRPGRIRSTRAQSARPFIAQALAAAKKAGGGVSRSGRVVAANRSRFGRGQRASIQANRFITART